MFSIIIFMKRIRDGRPYAIMPPPPPPPPPHPNPETCKNAGARGAVTLNKTATERLSLCLQDVCDW